RTVRSPAADDEVRRFDRFLWCWFVGGLTIFTLSPHNQARLMDPMVPAAALIAGREMDRVARAVPERWLPRIVAAGVVLALVVFGIVVHHVESAKPEVQETIALQRMAATIRDAVGDDFPLAFTADTPYAMQLALNTMRPPVTIAEAAALLHGPAAAYVLVHDLRRLQRALGPDAAQLHELAAAATTPGVIAVYLVS